MSIFGFQDPWESAYRQQYARARQQKQRQQELQRQKVMAERVRRAQEQEAAEEQLREYYRDYNRRVQEREQQLKREQLRRERQQEAFRRQQVEDEESASDESSWDERAAYMADPLAALFGLAPQRNARRRRGGRKPRKSGQKPSPPRNPSRAAAVTDDEPKADAAHKIQVEDGMDTSEEAVAPAREPMTEDEAATLIQRVWKGYTTRALELIPKLKKLRIISNQVNTILNNRDEVLDTSGASLQNNLRFDEELTQQLLKVDSIMSGRSTLVRERRRALVRQIEKELSELDDEKERLSNASESASDAEVSDDSDSHSDFHSDSHSDTDADVDTVMSEHDEVTSEHSIESPVTSDSDDSESEGEGDAVQSVSAPASSSPTEDYEMVEAEDTHDTSSTRDATDVNVSAVLEENEELKRENVSLKRRIDELEAALTEAERQSQHAIQRPRSA